jgi:chromosome segregation protein
MHLASLTLRGFKSFASSTTLRFEPGVTCVVGPNGSGKSNVVDALAWVMGEQGAKSLRGGKMEDVIFAGTAGRAPLGRAEVLLTIDNSDGALPIEYSEVTISRILFAGGGSEYAINGSPCRLLDVQELLSDSGIGREMHVIVGQGQLDAVLHASPEERRGFIEEAAGVLKHRKRKEKALRKLDAMQANLTRLEDLTTELRRQLGPLGRQAEIARRAATVQADVRDARLRLLADDLVAMRAVLAQEIADETALRERRVEVERALQDSQRREHELDAAAQAAAPVLAAAQDAWYRLVSLRERLRGTLGLAQERARQLAEPAAAEGTGRDPDELDAEARTLRADEADARNRLSDDVASLERCVAARTAAETALRAEEERLAALARAAADRREGIARLNAEIAAARTRLTTLDEEVSRLASAQRAAAARAERADREFTALESRIAGLDAGEENLDAAYERASQATREATERVERLIAAEHETERARAALAARVDALTMTLAPADGTQAVLDAAADGLLGSLSDLVRVEAGWEGAVAAALGAAADALVVESVEAAERIIERLREGSNGRARLVVAGGSDEDLPTHAGVRMAIEAVDAPANLRPALSKLLSRIVLVERLAEARALVAREPSLIAVTRAGDVVGAHFVEGGAPSSPSRLEVAAAVETASDELADVTARRERLRFELAEARNDLAQREADLAAALDRLHESDAAMAAVAEQLAHLGAEARTARAEIERITQGLERAKTAHAERTVELGQLEKRLATAQEPAPEADDTDRRVELDRGVTAAREREVEARLAVRTGEERADALAGRAALLERTAATEREIRERAAAQRVRRARDAATAAAVADAVREVLQRLEHSLTEVGRERDTAEGMRAERDATLTELRARTRELAADLERLVDDVHRDEIARAEQRMRVEALEARAVEELGVDPDTLIREFGPDQPVPPSAEAAESTEPAAPRPYVRAEQERRLRTGERALAQLGRVNPLALEEYAALEERQKFLAEQLADVRATRKDLLEIIREVDQRVQEAFTSAFEDTAREFQTIFERLFPGGEGKLVLTDPDDLVTTGVEVFARPAGKNVKRLSLLSGGERSLAAIALLVAIFKARPSPFYVLDEVEAALDDTNLGRLLGILEELRAESQLIIITHQKRTMEIADALYGVTMRGDGETKVISQRLREAVSA